MGEDILSNESVIRNFLNLPLKQLRKYPGNNLPTTATVRELNFIATNNSRIIMPYFSKASFNVAVPHGQIRSILDQIAAGGTNFNWEHVPYKNYDWKNGYNVKQDEKLTPLSLRCNESKYIVYVLSSEKDWKFSRATKYFNIPLSSGEDDGGGDYFFEHLQSPYDNIAYFICEGEAAINDRYNANKESYSYGVNLHIDLLFQETGGILPLVLDPDIRHPGGSGEP